MADSRKGTEFPGRGWILFCLLLWFGLPALAAPVPQDILVLYSFGPNVPAQMQITAGLDSVIEARQLRLGTFHHEYLDISPPRSPGQRHQLSALLHDKYAGVRFALIVTVFDAARDFLENEGADLSPGSPVVALFGRAEGAQTLPGRQVYPLPIVYDLRGTLEGALALFPRTRRVFFVGGNSEANLRVAEQARTAFAPWRGRLEITYSNDMPLGQMLEKAAHLPADSIILYSILSSDTTGALYVPTDALRSLVKAADAPVFCLLSAFLGLGPVGGAMIVPERAGAMIGEAVLEVQEGRPVSLPLPAAYVRNLYDWRQLRRWGGDPARLPAGSEIRFRPPTLWGQYRPHVIVASLVITLLVLGLLGLFALNRRMARAERALLESERFLREAQEAGSVATFVWDLRRDVFRITGGALSGVLGLEEGREVRFQAWLDLVCPEFRETMAGALEQAGLGEHPFELDFPVCPEADGEPSWMHGRARLERDGLGQPRRLLGTLQDVTGLRRAEQGRRQLQEELEHTQRLESLGNLAGGIAHDMDNTLAAIQAVAEALLAQHVQEPPLAQALATIARATTRGRDLVKGLTNFARKGLREPRLLSLNELVQEQGAILRRTLLQRVQVVEQLDPELPPVWGESATLGSALLNLCVNAGDAMPQGGTITLRTVNEGDGWVLLSVEDTGEGMAPDVLRRALEPYFTTKAFGKGTGLGLAMVFNTAKAHGGTVQLLSRPGAGTQVILRLPAASGALAAAPQTVETGAAGRPLRVLLVDDDSLIRETVPILLAQAGHQVEVTEGGAQALVRLEKGLPVDLVLLDLNMPVMGGVETLQSVRRIDPRLPALLATGYLDEATEAVLASTPFTAVLAKPYGLDEFQEKIRELGLQR